MRNEKKKSPTVYDRYTLRITRQQSAKMHRLPRIEKRKIACRVRLCLDSVLADWEKAHQLKPKPATP